MWVLRGLASGEWANVHLSEKYQMGMGTCPKVGRFLAEKFSFTTGALYAFTPMFSVKHF
jgi:hypothetical protein